MDTLAVLISGGLDSAILLGDALRSKRKVYPIYVRCGLYWEAIEFDCMRQYLQAVRCTGLQPLTILDQPVVDLYGNHWSTSGKEVPDADSPDEAVFLPGRNALLFTKALLWCHLNSIPALGLGVIGTNPFPDARADFFRKMQDAINQSVGGQVEIHLPFASLTKKEIMLLGHDLPLQFTFSCIAPHKGRHCGMCNKCAERRRAFTIAGMTDPTVYVR